MRTISKQDKVRRERLARRARKFSVAKLYETAISIQQSKFVSFYDLKNLRSNPPSLGAGKLKAADKVVKALEGNGK